MACSRLHDITMACIAFPTLECDRDCMDIFGLTTGGLIFALETSGVGLGVHVLHSVWGWGWVHVLPPTLNAAPVHPAPPPH